LMSWMVMVNENLFISHLLPPAVKGPGLWIRCRPVPNCHLITVRAHLRELILLTVAVKRFDRKIW